MLPCHGNVPSSILGWIVISKQLLINCKPIHSRVLIMFSSAIESIKDTYSVETLREIVEHGCASGVAHDHIYYADCIKFYDTYEDEITDYIVDNFGVEMLTELFDNNEGNLRGYKNDLVWTFIEMNASTIIEEYEDVTCQELSDLDEEVYPNLTELSNTEWGKDHLEIVTL